MSKVPIVAIVGRANVGKSSIFNRLLERREAIVANEPGTTRDAISGRVYVNGKSFWLVDTAGLKTPEDDFELSIQEQILQATDSADMILVTVDASVDPSEEDRRVAKLALKSKKPVVLVVSKSDTLPKEKPAFEKLGIKQVVEVSSIHNRGFDELIAAISDHVDFSKDKDSTSLRVSFVGRPNVGKSSLFNVLLEKQQAVVADVAGTTRDTNKKQIRWHSQTIELLDTAGIRRSGKIGNGIEHFSVLRALSAIEQSDVCCLVLDATELATKLDQKIAGMVSEAGKGLIIVVNKWDLVEKDEFTRDKLAKTLQREMPFVAWASLIFTSAETTQNVSKLFTIATEIHQRRQSKLKTRDLNLWLQKAISHHPPAGLKNTHPKLKYVTQTEVGPPHFRFFGSDMKTLHWSYKRYLEREIRQLSDYTGTAISLSFTDKKAE